MVSITKQHFLLLSLFTIVLISGPTLAQQPPAEAPGPAAAAAKLGPINVVKILTKAKTFKSFVRLLKTTQLDSNLNNQLGDSNNGITIFAPNDAAFAKLKPGTLGQLTRQEKLQLAQFHIVPVFISRSGFDSVGNPVQTHAGSGDLLQLNVTSTGGGPGGPVSLETGVTNTTLSDTVYMDTHLAIYQVDKVLQPMSIFGAPDRAQSPAPAAAKGKGSKSGDVGDDESGDDGGDDDDGVGGKRSNGAVVVHSSTVVVAVFAGVISVALTCCILI
ncbi:unnamed protein product [Linum trigynum]|uniref:FAS1 domain-containing protein n=1 Tax=Linum trigynum TaxID=586398 RepID=A0AAV2FZG5_9ROSI